MPCNIVCLLMFICINLHLYPLDSSFSLWTGCYTTTSPQRKRALLCCVAINGYHSCVSYKWVSDADEFVIGDTPLLYCSRGGRYKCTVTEDLEDLQEEKEFSVVG